MARCEVASSVGLPRYILGSTANLAVWVLRVFVLLISAMVVCTFILSLL